MGKPAVTPGNFHEWGKKNHMGVIRIIGCSAVKPANIPD